MCGAVRQPKQWTKIHARYEKLCMISNMSRGVNILGRHVESRVRILFGHDGEQKHPKSRRRELSSEGISASSSVPSASASSSLKRSQLALRCLHQLPIHLQWSPLPYPLQQHCSCRPLTSPRPNSSCNYRYLLHPSFRYGSSLTVVNAGSAVSAG